MLFSKFFQSLKDAIGNFSMYIEGLDKRSKFYIYASPLLIVVFVYINADNIKGTSNEPLVKTSKQTKRYYPINKMLTLVSKISSKNKIKIYQLDVKNKQISLSANAKIKDILAFLEQISSVMKIQIFSISKQSKDFHIDILLGNQMVLLKNQRHKIDMSVLKVFEDVNQEIYSPLAIVGEWVYLDDKWKKAGDKYNGYIIKKVYAKKIILLDEVTNKTKEKIIIK